MVKILIFLLTQFQLLLVQQLVIFALATPDVLFRRTLALSSLEQPFSAGVTDFVMVYISRYFSAAITLVCSLEEWV